MTTAGTNHVECVAWHRYKSTKAVAASATAGKLIHCAVVLYTYTTCFVYPFCFVRACPHACVLSSARSNCSRDRGLRAFLEAAGAVVVLFCLSWRLAPAVSVVIVVTAVAAAMYRRSTRPVEAAQSAALQRMAGVAYQAFQNMRTVRSFAGASGGVREEGSGQHHTQAHPFHQLLCLSASGERSVAWAVQGECRCVLRFSCNHPKGLASTRTPATLPRMRTCRACRCLSCDTPIRGGSGEGTFPVRGGRLLCSRAPVWCCQGLV